METPIIIHGEWEDNYDDPSHPIPSLSALDVEGIKKGGGADLIIVIASPLGADERSRRRLLAKIEIYLKYLDSAEFVEKAGMPTPDNTCIIVHLHPESDPEILDVIERCKPWVRTKSATLYYLWLEV